MRKKLEKENGSKGEKPKETRKVEGKRSTKRKKIEIQKREEIGKMGNMKCRCEKRKNEKKRRRFRRTAMKAKA